MFLDQVTPLILTYNEAVNIGRSLAKLRWAREIIVVDSFSDDDTEEIAKSFSTVRFYQRAFDTHQNQWNFGLSNTGIKTPWVLALDADYVLTDELISELELLQPEATTSGYSAGFIYCLNGKRLRSGVYPAVTVLFRREYAMYLQDGHTHRACVTGEIKDLQSRILHDDRKPLARWFISQARYTELEAEKLLKTEKQNLSWTDRMRRLCLLAPPLMLIYCLFVRGGILDGWAGLRYAFERTIAELMLSLHLIQHRLGGLALANTRLVEKPKPQATETSPNLKIQSS